MTGGDSMYIPLGVKTDYSLLQSLIKIPDLIAFAVDHHLPALGIVDDNLFSVMNFYHACKSKQIKPLIGLEVKLNNQSIYLYAKNYAGYQTLLKINTLIQERAISLSDLKMHNYQVLCILPFTNHELYADLSDIYADIYLGYRNITEKNNALIITNKIVYFNVACALSKDDTAYLDYLAMIKEGKNKDEVTLNQFADLYLQFPDNQEDEETTSTVAEALNVEIPLNNRYIPHYDVPSSEDFLYSLAKKGLTKRLNNQIPPKYVTRLKHELDIIKQMGFVDYFLIVYDYVKYAKTHDILAWPRGSAAGSLVSYALGISEVDPIKYDLLFERFLNPDRVTLPDIDVDFDHTRREEVINYVKDKYGHDKVATIMAFGTLASKQAIRDVAKCLNVDPDLTDRLAKMIDANLSLKDNARAPQIKALVKENPQLLDTYKIAMKLEGLKRHITTHAAGVVISSLPLDELIPICLNNGETLTGLTMEYLESMGLLKMDFLALRNLSIIKNILNLIKQYAHIDLKLNTIPLDDQATIGLFRSVDTEGIFQFESAGMKSFLRKLQVSSFSDLIAAVALFRPGPMQNIDSFIARKHGREKIDYLHPNLKPILQDTYGIMIYQEQIMQVLVTMGNYTFAEADNIRRAMSKKKHEVMEKERYIFIQKSVENGYSEELAKKVYDLIIKFADYGFNKAHSVSYALLGYQMAYLKSRYPVFFIANLLNMSISSEIKTKEYIDEARSKDIKIARADINISDIEYVIQDNTLTVPLSIVKGIGFTISKQIVQERNEHGLYKDYLDVIVRLNHLGLTRKVSESLIQMGALDSFGLNRKTMLMNLDNALNYASLCQDLDESLVLKPIITEYEEDDPQTIMQNEQRLYGFYVSNHPASKYCTPDIVKIKDAPKFFDKHIKLVCLISNIHRFKTKTNTEMAMFNASDETGTIGFVIFANKNSLLKNLKSDKLYLINGQVTRRNYNYEIVVKNITEV